jgi:hypothetical protein
MISLSVDLRAELGKIWENSKKLADIRYSFPCYHMSQNKCTDQNSFKKMQSSVVSPDKWNKLLLVQVIIIFIIATEFSIHLQIKDFII